MTFNTDIQKTEKEIAVLQKKLELLKEIETHKSQSPRMEFGCGGKFEIVSYNFVDYCRYEWNDGSHKWYKRKYADEGVVMVAITDGETHRLLEGVWFNDVKKGKYDDVVDEHKSPVEEAFKEIYGIYPTFPSDARFGYFKTGYEAAQSKDVGVQECPDEPEHYDEVEWDEKDNPASYITDEVVNRMVEKYKSQKLYNMVRNELGYSFNCCDEFVDLVERWLPKEQSAEGSQNVNTELLVDGFNDCLRKIKEMLR